MSIMVIACQCGSSQSLARNFLKGVGYPEWFSIPIYQGKEKSLAVTSYLPHTPEKEMLQSFLKGASKWVVIIGYNDKACRWSDIAHNAPKSKIEAEYIVGTFQFD